jgi:hypothetical protein
MRVETHTSRRNVFIPWHPSKDKVQRVYIHQRQGIKG